MAKNIKFRGWYKPTSVMFNVYGFNKANVFEYTCNGILTSKTNPANREDCVLLQFTGLLDKDGQEIYEGDIFECIYKRKDRHADHLYEIAWSDNKSCFYRKLIGKSCLQTGVVQTMMDCTRQSIIGNIYENKDLVKQFKTENK